MLFKYVVNQLALFVVAMTVTVMANATTNTTTDRVKAIREIKLLKEPVLTSQLAFIPAVDYKKKLFVAAGSLVTASDSLKPEETEDVINSTLFAQLAADHDFNRNTQMPYWYRRYSQVMSLLGWDISDFSETLLQTSSLDVSVNEVIFDILKATLTKSSDLAIISAAITSLKKLEKGGPFISLFNKTAVSSHAANFQASFVTHDEDGLLSMNLGYLVVGFATVDTTVFFIRAKSGSTSIDSHRQTVKLDYDIYNQVRDEVVSKLGIDSRTKIAGIAI